MLKLGMLRVGHPLFILPEHQREAQTKGIGYA